MRIVVAIAALLSWTVPTVANESVIYRYDAAGRIGSALYDNGLCVAYTYDANGNRTSQTNANTAAAATWGSASWGCFKWTNP